VQHDVLWFYVTVDDLGGVQLINSSADLFHDSSHLDLSQWLDALELLEELSAHGHLQDDVDMFFVVEAAVQLDDFVM
jgi:hypothetical protein